MDDLPLHQSAEILVGSNGPVVVAELLDAIAGSDGPAATLSARLGGDDPVAVDHADLAVDHAELVAAASREATRLADIHVRPEHLVLALVELAGGPLERARGVLQVIMGERAHADYEGLRPVVRAEAPRLVLVAGVPGTGKSTLAEALAWRLRAPVFSMDWQLGALVPFGVLRADNTVPLADLNLTASAARQLGGRAVQGVGVLVGGLGVPVVNEPVKVDGVNSAAVCLCLVGGTDPG
ncbi:AAA family ATPase [Actinosynnema sp. CS-041913]|uniref:AAA family ATPase n=1 Tax=Actinosynnema sp. CS-041913 TaxID=3239917 RepID=UPI003D941AA0